ncbi:hypothetical protein VTK26DRAFT_7370 [Humicola hyalothermophila]
MPADPNIIHAYRHLLRAGLRAVQFAQPARSTLVRTLRAGFRDPRGTFDAERARRTVWFLNAAAQQRGLEHRIVKNLLQVEWLRSCEERRKRLPWKQMLKVGKDKKAKMERGRFGGIKTDVISGTQYEHYERTIMMLNDTMGLCLR